MPTADISEMQPMLHQCERSYNSMEVDAVSRVFPRVRVHFHFVVRRLRLHQRRARPQFGTKHRPAARKGSACILLSHAQQHATEKKAVASGERHAMLHGATPQRAPRCPARQTRQAWAETLSSQSRTRQRCANAIHQGRTCCTASCSILRLSLSRSAMSTVSATVEATKLLAHCPHVCHASKLRRT